MGGKILLQISVQKKGSLVLITGTGIHTKRMAHKDERKNYQNTIPWLCLNIAYINK